MQEPPPYPTSLVKKFAHRNPCDTVRKPNSDKKIVEINPASEIQTDLRPGLAARVFGCNGVTPVMIEVESRRYVHKEENAASHPKDAHPRPSKKGSASFESQRRSVTNQCSPDCSAREQLGRIHHRQLTKESARGQVFHGAQNAPVNSQLFTLRLLSYFHAHA